MTIKGYILDIDNTLVNSTEAHYRSWKRALEENGIHKERDVVIAEFGRPTNKIAETLAGGDQKLGNKVAKEKTDYLLETFADADLFDHVEALIEKLHGSDLKISFASSNFNEVIEHFLKIHKWDSIASGFAGIDDVNFAKPHPAMLFKCIGQMQLVPKECVMVGDSIYDLEAGRRAGTRTIGVCTGHYSRDELDKYQPDLILNEIGELVEMLPLDF